MKKQRNKNIDKHKNSWHNLETVSEDGSNNNKTTSISIEKKRPETNGKSNETKSIIDKMHYKLANSLKILSFITCAEISFKNAKTLKQKLHIGFVFFCCCWSFLGYIINYIWYLTSNKDLCDENIIIPGWNYIRKVRKPGYTRQQQQFSWLEGIVWLLPILAFYGRPKKKAERWRKLFDIKVAKRISVLNENSRCNIHIGQGGEDGKLLKMQSEAAIVAWTISLICTGLSAGWFNGPGFHKRPPVVLAEFFDVFFITIVTFFAFASFAYSSVFFRLAMYNHHFEVKQLINAIKSDKLQEPRKIIKIDKEIHRDMKETGEKLSMYLLLTTIGVALIVLSTMVTCIVYWEKFVSVEQAAAAGVASNTTSILISNNTGANANVATTKDIGDCIPEINGVKVDTSGRPEFFISRRLFYCFMCCLPVGWCLYAAGNLGTRFTYLLREILNAKFDRVDKIEELTYLNSHFHMRKLAKDSGIVMFNVGIDTEFLGAAATIFLSLCSVIAGVVSRG